LRGLIFVLILYLSFSGCQETSLLLKPVIEGTREEGEVFLYSRPFPQEADRLRFSIEKISALKDDGMLFPLYIKLSEIKGSDMKRQRLIASAHLPPGRYTGLSFKIRDATVKIEEGEAALLVPDEPVSINFPFHVNKRKSFVISMLFNHEKAIRKRFIFNPAFSLSIPEKPLFNLIGYVANYDSDNITVFDKKSLMVVDVISVGDGPSGIALDQARRRAYVTLSGEDTVEVIDVQAGKIINTILLITGDEPQEPVITPDGKFLLTANRGSDTVSIINPLTFIEIKRIKVGDGPNSIVIDPGGKRAYVFNTLSSTISVIDLATHSIAATISAETGPLRGQFNRDGDRLYVIHESSSYVVVIDPFSLSTLNRIYVGMGATAIKFDIETDLFYIGKKNDIRAEVYSQFTLLPVDFIEAGGGISYMTIDGEENSLYLVMPENKTSIIINIVSKEIISEIDVGDGPYWLTMMGER
jgi:YVTN family beta-propeller protein